MNVQKRLGGGSCLAALLWLSAAAIGQTGTQDQVSPYTNAWFNGSASSLIWQAQVRVGIAGQLEGFELQSSGPQGAGLNVRLRLGPGWNTGAVVFSDFITKPTGGTDTIFVDATSANLNFNVGDLFVIEMQGNDTGFGITGSYVAPPGNPLYPEFLFLNGPGCFADCGWRIGFRTFMLQAPTFALRADGTCPGGGPITVTWTGATVGGQVGVLYANSTGSFVIPPSSPCAGTVTGLSSSGIQLVFQGGSGAGGTRTINGQAPGAACGKYLQAVDGATCNTSNVVQIL